MMASVVCKTIKANDSKEADAILNDIQVLSQIPGSEGFVVQCYGVTKSQMCNTQIQLILEFMDFGSLIHLKKVHVPADAAAAIASQVVSGIAFLHGNRMLHGAIQPSNVLLSRHGHVKLSESIQLPLELQFYPVDITDRYKTYMAPERCMGEAYSYPADVWSVGMVIHEIVSGAYPFGEVSSFPALFEALMGTEPRLNAEMFPAALCDFLAKCLLRSASLRAPATELAVHEFTSMAQNLAAWLSSLT